MNKDPEWQKYIKRGGATPVFYKEAKFTEIVNKDKKVFTDTLRDLGAIK
jgi:tripartite-type tricarboxylate transporter receptor subunit TctC